MLNLQRWQTIAVIAFTALAVLFALPNVLPASVLDQQTAMRWMRIGGGVTFSTLDRYSKGRASLPYSVTVSYESTIWGGGGRVPQATVFHVTLRGYVRLFGS